LYGLISDLSAGFVVYDLTKSENLENSKWVRQQYQRSSPTDWKSMDRCLSAVHGVNNAQVIMMLLLLLKMLLLLSKMLLLLLNDDDVVVV